MYRGEGAEIEAGELAGVVEIVTGGVVELAEIVGGADASVKTDDR